MKKYLFIFWFFSLHYFAFSQSSKDLTFFHPAISDPILIKNEIATELTLKLEKQIVEKEIFTQHNDSLPYRLIHPDNESLTQKYPLLIYLHGSGSRGNDNEKPLQKLPSYFTDSLIKSKYPCFILIPQCPEKDVWVSFPDFPNNIASTTDATPPAKLVLALIHHLIASKNINSNRIYLTGFSMGGEGTFDLLSREPDLFACGVPLASVADTSNAHIMINIPIWAFHGNADAVNDIKYTRMMIEAIKQHGGNPKFTELKEVQHNCLKETYRNSELWEWIFNQTKK